MALEQYFSLIGPEGHLTLDSIPEAAAPDWFILGECQFTSNLRKYGVCKGGREVAGSDGDDGRLGLLRPARRPLSVPTCSWERI